MAEATNGGRPKLSRREQLIGKLADEMVDDKPGLLTEEDRTMLRRYLTARCAQYLADRANDVRMEVANKLIRKRDSGIPWTPDEQRQAEFYGVRGA